MESADLREALRSGVTLAVDTNAVFGRRLLQLADQVNRLREPPTAFPVVLVIPALVHAEHLAQVRPKRADFSAEVAQAALISKGFGADGPHRIAAFNASDAEASAAILARWTLTDWPLAKQRRCAAMLGVPLPEKAGRCSATVDWFIAAQAEAQGWLLITDDGGPEFQGHTRRSTYNSLMRALEALLP